MVIFAFLMNAFWYRFNDVESFSSIWSIHTSHTHNWDTISLSQEFVNLHFWHPAKCPHIKHFNSIVCVFCIQPRLDDPATSAVEILCSEYRSFNKCCFSLQVKCLVNLVDFDQSAKPGVMSWWHSEHFVVDVVGISIQSVKVFESSANSTLLLCWPWF